MLTSTLGAALSSAILSAQIVIVSEQHGHAVHHERQVELIERLSSDRKVSVGFEFFDLTQQASVDAFVEGALPELEFLARVGWGKSPDFALYRRQALHARSRWADGARTVALNLPRAVSGKISRDGIESLSAEERALIPADFVRGGDLYRERFAEAMGEHVSPEKLTRYFEAQSAWDEVMATSALEFARNHPDQVLVILVGDFHAAYGGGLPARLVARGLPRERLHVVSQVDSTGLSAEERRALIEPHARYGARADSVWDAATAASGNP